jgi:hypothetical protein
MSVDTAEGSRAVRGIVGHVQRPRRLTAGQLGQVSTPPAAAG